MLAEAEIAVLKKIIMDVTLFSPFLKNARRGKGLAVLSLLLTLGGGVFLLAAFYMWTDERYSPLAATGLTGGLMIVLAGLSLSLSHFFLHRRKRHDVAAPFGGDWEALVPEMFGIFERDIEAIVAEHPKLTLAAAAAAGFLAKHRYK